MSLREKTNYWQQDIKRREYVMAFLSGIFIIVSISYLFYHSIWMNVFLSPLLVLYMILWKKQCIDKKEKQFQLQFKDSLQALAIALRVGYSMENAIKDTYKEMLLMHDKETRIIRELHIMVSQLAVNMTTEKILEEFAERVHQEDVQNFVTVFSSSKRMGGDSVAVLQRTVKSICEKMEVKKEIDIILAAKKIEFKVMTLIPFVMLGYMKVSFPEFMKTLYGNVAGQILMTGCLITFIFSYWIGKKIIEIEV